jgi:hypothetical protein
MEKLQLSIVVFMLSGSSLLAADGGTQVVVPFVDGMTITTSNSVANVEIRAQSLGPGACAVEFSAGDKTIGLLAPPLVYTGWSVLTSHIGSVTFTLSDDVKCDTGVLAQVRYYK